jgi:hypothetical protein
LLALLLLLSFAVGLTALVGFNYLMEVRESDLVLTRFKSIVCTDLRDGRGLFVGLPFWGFGWGFGVFEGFGVAFWFAEALLPRVSLADER